MADDGPELDFDFNDLPDETYGFDTSLHLLPFAVVLGYGLVYEHEYVAWLVKSLADSIATLKVIEIPRAGSRQYIGFLELTDEFCLDLQPGDAMKVNFNIEEPESHTDWHACVVDTLPIAPPMAVTILLTRPWDKEKREWVRFDDDLEPSVIKIDALGPIENARSRLIARDSQQVAVNVLFSDKPFHRQITALRELQKKRVEKVSTWSTLLGNNFIHLQAVDAYQTIADVNTFVTQWTSFSSNALWTDT